MRGENERGKRDSDLTVKKRKKRIKPDKVDRNGRIERENGKQEVAKIGK